MKRALRDLRCRRGMILAALWLSFLGQSSQIQAESGSAQTGGHPKSAWQWTLDERLTARFDPRAEEERLAKRRARSRGAFPGSPTPVLKHPVGHVIQGGETPELFLSFELFDALINRSFPPDGLHQNEWRRRYEERAAALGLGRDLWPRIEKAAAGLLERRRERYRRSREEPLQGEANLAKDSFDVEACRARAQAITAVRKELGQELFSRLLYEAVAPSLNIVSSPRPDLQIHLRFVEGGCR